MSILSLQQNMGGAPIWDNPNVFAGDVRGNPVNPKAGQVCYLWARVYNQGSTAINNVTVSYYVLLPSGNSQWPPQGHGTCAIAQVAAMSSVLASCTIPWIPDSSLSSHQCIVAVAFCDECPPPPTVPGTPINLYDIQVGQHNVNIQQLSANTAAIIRPFNITDSGNAGYAKISRAPLAENAALLSARGISPDIPEAPNDETAELIDPETGKSFGDTVNYKLGESYKLCARITPATRNPGTAALYHVQYFENEQLIGGVSNIVLH